LNLTVTKFAGSLLLSCFDLVLCLSALLLGLVFKSAPAFVLFIFWVVLPVCLLITVIYLVVDFVSQRSKQAMAALLLLLPTLAVQIWFYKSLDL
jgi:hypothetical protein